MTFRTATRLYVTGLPLTMTEPELEGLDARASPVSALYPFRSRLLHPRSGGKSVHHDEE